MWLSYGLTLVGAVIAFVCTIAESEMHKCNDHYCFFLYARLLHPLQLMSVEVAKMEEPVSPYLGVPGSSEDVGVHLVMQELTVRSVRSTIHSEEVHM